MTVTSQTIALTHADVARRLLANVDAGTSDQSPGQMKVPATAYRDPGRWELEMEQHLPPVAARRRPLLRPAGARVTSTRSRSPSVRC